MSTNYNKNNKNKSNTPKREKVEIPFKDITEDFSSDIETEKKIIIFVEHSKSYAKEYAFKTYINKKFQYRGDKYIVAIKHLEFIPLENINSSRVAEILKTDLEIAYNDFKEKYPNAKLEKAYSFNYAIDYSEKSKKGEIMTIGIMKTSENYTRVQFSPIVAITKVQYDMIMGKDDSKEGKLLNDIILEKRMGIEQYGIIGYLTNGKIKTHNMYMECLLDLMSEYKNEEKFRPKILEYKNYRVSRNAYLYSIKTEKEREEFLENENEPVV